MSKMSLNPGVSMPPSSLFRPNITQKSNKGDQIKAVLCRAGP